MRRAMILLVALGAMLALVAGVAVAANVDCSDNNNDRCEGTDNSDRIEGTGSRDAIFAKAGDDDIFPRGGSDTVNAAKGDDFIDSRDGNRDVIDCGKGNDEVRADNKDVTSDCDGNVNRP